jgi:hypothetical protein
MVFLGVFVGYFVGKFLLGGIYYALFVPESVDPESARGKSIEFVFSVIGAILGGVIMS